MAIKTRRETRWVYSTPAEAREAEGQTCVLCGEEIRRDRHPCLWLKKIFQNGRETRFFDERGYAHGNCTEDAL
jgi:hypothetical protein